MAPARAEPAWATTDFGIFVTLVGKRLKGLAKGPALELALLIFLEALEEAGQEGPLGRCCRSTTSSSLLRWCPQISCI